MPDLTTYDYDIFLSHNRADQEWTAKLAERIEKEDWPKQNRKLKVFFSPWDIRPGQSIPKKIEEALPRSRKVGLILSPDAVDSAWVELERLVTTYIDISARDERLIPLYRRNCEVPALLRSILYLDFRDDGAFEESYKTLLLVIKDEPLPRRPLNDTVNSVVLPPLIPRPPVVGFLPRRDSEGRNIVERLQQELAPQKNQLIALSGPGGVGKTTLASETARALSEKHTQRIVWVGADGRDDFTFSTLLDETAGQLGRIDLRPLPTDVKADEVGALIAAAPTLIVLDNFETLAAAEQARCVDFLLNRAPCPVLITTRPRIAAARNIIIPVMSPDEADNFLRLLIHQAGEPSAFGSVDRQRIMTASDRNPLVTQWVVAQIDLAQEASSVLDELAHGVGDAAERVFDRSFRLERLGDDGRDVLLALSLFSPDASRTALAEVAFGEGAKRLNEAVKRLASLWLIKTTTEGQRLYVEGLTRELAKARLANDGRAKEFYRRFVTYFLSYTERRAAPTPENLDELEIEKDNLLGAMDLASEIEDLESLQRIVLLLVEPSKGMLIVHGYWNDAIQRGQEALKAAKVTNRQWYVGALANNLGFLLANQGNHSSAKQHYQLAVEVARQLNEEGGLAATLHQLAMLAQNQGELAEARRLLHESLEINKKLDHQGAIAANLHELGLLAQNQDELDEARRLYNESLEINKRLGSHFGIATTLQNLATIALDQGERDEARQLCLESLEIKKKLGHQEGIATSLHHLGMLAEDEGHQAEAAQLFEDALAILNKLKSPNAEIALKSLERVKVKSS